MKRALLALFVAFTVVSTPITGSVAASPAINFDSEDAPNPEITEDAVTIATHDMSDMSGPLDYYNDSGTVETLPATVNQSQETPLGVRFDKIDADRYDLFPRIDGETGNNANWTDTTEWTTTSGASSSVSVNDADAHGIDRVEVASTVATGETATATLSKDVSITSDPNKRVMFGVVNVDNLASGSSVELRVTDSDGDYRYATISSSSTASNSDVIASSTGNGYVFSERVGNLPIAGTGDGTLDGIQSVDIVTSENDATVTLSGLDLDKKTETNLADIERDTDGDGELETTTIKDYYEGGEARITGLDSLGSDYSNAQINDLTVYDVSYALSDLSDSESYDVEFTTGGTEYSYPAKVEIYADLEAPTAIDVSHGSLALEFNQSFIGERYKTVELASGASSSTDFVNSTYSDVSGSLTGEDTTATLSNSVSSGDIERLHMVIVLQDDEVEDLRAGGAMGPTGSESGGFFSTLTGQITGLVAAIATALGIGRFAGGS